MSKYENNLNKTVRSQKVNINLVVMIGNKMVGLMCTCPNINLFICLNTIIQPNISVLVNIKLELIV